MRRLALGAGVALTVIAVAAATRVADTREGLIAEIVTLLGGAAGVSLLIYGLTARRRATRPAITAAAAKRAAPPVRTRRDVFLGAGGIALWLALLSGLAVTGGAVWAVLGFALLLPMLCGSVYLCIRYVRAGPASDSTSPTR